MLVYLLFTLLPICWAKLAFYGVNEAGFEFNQKGTDVIKGTNYFPPTTASLTYFSQNGYNIIRLPFRMENMVTSLTDPLNNQYVQDYQATVAQAKNLGLSVILDPHNYLRFNNQVIGSNGAPPAADFVTFWTNLATLFANDDQVLFNLMNEPHDLGGVDYVTIFKNVIAAIRTVSSNTVILVPHNGWTGAHAFGSDGSEAEMANFVGMPNVVFDFHQYLDSDFSGTHPDCVSVTALSDNLKDATAWLQQNNAQGFLGETGAGNTATCLAALTDGLTYLNTNNVWLGVTLWSAGAQWGSNFLSIEPPSSSAPAGQQLELYTAFAQSLKILPGVPTPADVPSNDVPSVAAAPSPYDVCHESVTTCYAVKCNSADTCKTRDQECQAIESKCQQAQQSDVVNALLSIVQPLVKKPKHHHAPKPSPKSDA